MKLPEMNFKNHAILFEFIILSTVFISSFLLYSKIKYAVSLKSASTAHETFVTIVNPVRSREIWKDLFKLQNQLDDIKNANLPSTLLLQYDCLKDKDLISLIQKSHSNQLETGIFMEVSQDLADDAHVKYIVGDGDYYRPDKVFLSGYSPDERKRLINTVVNKYEKVFNQKPESVGAWYIDANSQRYLYSLGFTSALTLSDQYDTDAASIWGKYFAYPFYPSKYNALEPASTIENKIPLVNIQWAQRDPVTSYGKKIVNSRESLQANDYISNGHDTDYFINLFNLYADNNFAPFNQITIGLEAGQEGSAFSSEFQNQLKILNKLQNEGKVKAVTMNSFAKWYGTHFPELSPAIILNEHDNIWAMTPHFRIGIFKENNEYIVKDLRFYNNHVLKDYLYADRSKYLTRRSESVIDEIENGTILDLGTQKDIKLSVVGNSINIVSDNESFSLDPSGLRKNGIYLLKNINNNPKNKFLLALAINSLKSKLADILSVLKFSSINNNGYFGLALNSNKLIGFENKKPGIYSFSTQTLLHFKSPSNLIERWQPWVN